MADLFKDIVPSILKTKKEVVTIDNEKEYKPFIVNRSLSFYNDCVFYANEMNKLPNTPALLQYHFLLNTVRSYKRRLQKWQTKDYIDGLEAVKEYFNYSNEKAKEAMTILSNDQIDEIKRLTDKGGLNDKSKRTRRGDAK